MSTKLLGRSLQFLPLSYIVVDHIGLDHDTRDITTEEVITYAHSEATIRARTSCAALDYGHWLFGGCAGGDLFIYTTFG